MLLGVLPVPFAVEMRRLSPEMASALGYHSVGMKPAGDSVTDGSHGCSSCLVSNTATASIDALAAKRRSPSEERAIAIGTAPAALSLGRLVRYSRPRTPAFK